MPRAAFLFLLTLALVVGGALDARAGERVALVIGNSSYAEVDRLRNPANDAVAVAEALGRLGFDKVALKQDLDYTGLRRALAEYSRAADGAETALIYYAGHGIEVGGQNYLIPVDAKLQSPRDVDYEATPLAFVMSALEGAKKLRVVILDACRNNPFRSRMVRLSGTRSVGRGFARVAAGANTLVAYAAKDGTTANDGDGMHSPYAAALLSHLETPGLEIGFLFRRVRDTVVSATGGRQEPFVYGSLAGESYYLKPPPASNGDDKVSPQAPVSMVARAWEAVKNTKDAAVLEAFLKEYPDGVYAALARSRLKQLKEQEVAVGVFPDKPKVAGKSAFKPGEEFRDCDECPKMVVVPAGSFIMGQKRQEVRISKPFAVGKFEVTFSEWDTCVSAEGCYHKPVDRGWGRGRRPVINVSWNNAKEYVQWLSHKTGQRYRLLSEAEWEYAARAGTTTPFSTGRTITTDQANFNGKGSNRRKTVTVGNYSANNFGLHDMHGNVWEWVEDCWFGGTWWVMTDGSASTNNDCRHHVRRGGSWDIGPWFLRIAYRGRGVPVDRDDSVGFRVARTL